MKKLLLTGLLLTLFGCSTNTAGLRVDSAVQGVLYGESALDDDLEIVNITKQDNNGNVRGLVEVENKLTSDLAIQYRFVWYDADGVEVPTRQYAWRQVILRGYEKKSLTEVAVDANAEDFRLHIRPQD